MRKDTAGIFGTTGANLTFTIDAATIVRATLIVKNQPDSDLKVKASNREVTVPSLPASDALVSLALRWDPQDKKDARIDVGTVTQGTGTVSAKTPKHAIDSWRHPGFVELFGK